MSVLIGACGLTLRPLTTSDLDFIVKLDSDPRVTEHLPGASKMTESEKRSWLESLHLPTEEEPWGFFALSVDGAQGAIGWLHLRPEANEPRYWDLGWRLKAAFWGRGLATKAARLLIDHAITEMGAELFSARTLSANGASIRVMQKLGMRLDSRFLWNDEIPAERWVKEASATDLL